MAAGDPPVVFFQRAADSTPTLLPNARVLLFDEGLEVTHEPDTSVTGSPDAPGALTGVVRVKLGGSVTTPADGSVYRHASGVATVGKDAGLTQFRIRNPAGDGYTLNVAGGVATLSGTSLTTDGSVYTTGGAIFSTEAGYAYAGTMTDVVAAGIASGLSPGSWVTYAAPDLSLKAVRQDLLVVVLGGGPSSTESNTETSSGAAPVAVLALSLPDNSAATFDLRVVARTTGPEILALTLRGCLAFVNSGSFSLSSNIGSIERLYTTGLPPDFSAGMFGWSGGVLTLTPSGPTIAVTGTADNGGGKVRVTCASGGLTVDLNSHAVDISGIVGTTEANGTNLTATYVSATEFDLLGVSFVNPWASGGTVVLHDAHTWHWSAWGQLVTAS